MRGGGGGEKGTAERTFTLPSESPYGKAMLSSARDRYCFISRQGDRRARKDRKGTERVSTHVRQRGVRANLRPFNFASPPEPAVDTKNTSEK